MNRNDTNSCKSDTKSIQSDTKYDANGTNSRESEQLSDWELKELMGMNRDTYRRGPSGAVRRR
ncbi:hypothetical protein CSV79_01645 [Sporosarcina sp. P13]|uniref:hypothetical protein n=1 Tax=Sporosarcina sp. P13 TaxID=2048263 RepID=UPI000C16E2B5|nr:hypothetical protein [Sporosarcina sp. P13]PIC65351.1 hypothetical protein CSV79_01645 [Sporosarcina sp. P13]